jgi:colanic acid/amylovoran biosynthesis protein WcaK/AmsJ
VKRVSIVNTVACNGGDAAILQAVFSLVRTALGEDTTFTVFDTHASVAAQHYPAISFRPQLWVTATQSPAWARALPRRFQETRVEAALDRPRLRALLGEEERTSIAILGESDLVVSTGGTYFVPTYRIRPRAFELGLAERLGRPYVLYTQSIGAFRARADRALLARVLRGARLVMLRDEASLHNAIDLGADEARCLLAPDAAFGLADPEVLARAPARRLPGGGLRVAISVRDWSRFAKGSKRVGMRRFETAVRALAEHLVRAHGAQVTFLSTCQGIPEYGIDDSAVAVRVAEGLGDAVRVDRDFHDPDALRRRLADFDLVVATRMHVAILALLAGTPVLPFAYEFKTRELFAGLGFGEEVHDVEAVDAESVVQGAERFLRDIDGRRTDLFARVAGMRERVLAAALRVREVVA